MAENNSSAPLKTAEGAYPALPKPAYPAQFNGHGGEQSSDEGYSAEQMRAYAAQAVAPQAQPADALDAETIKKAARYDWLRSGNDYQSDGPMVVLYESEGDRGDRPYWSIASDALDASIDAAMAAAQEGGKASAGKDGAA